MLHSTEEATVLDRAALAMETAAALTRMKPCCLCSGPSNVLGAYEPDNTPGRLILYPVCEDCLETVPNATEQIEQVIARHPRIRVRER
jgi:hypothetical protein